MVTNSTVQGTLFAHHGTRLNNIKTNNLGGFAVSGQNVHPVAHPKS